MPDRKGESSSCQQRGIDPALRSSTVQHQQTRCPQDRPIIELLSEYKSYAEFRGSATWMCGRCATKARVSCTGTHGTGRSPYRGYIGLHLICYSIHETLTDRRSAMSHPNRPTVKKRHHWLHQDVLIRRWSQPPSLLARDVNQSNSVLTNSDS